MVDTVMVQPSKSHTYEAQLGDTPLAKGNPHTDCGGIVGVACGPPLLPPPEKGETPPATGHSDLLAFAVSVREFATMQRPRKQLVVFVSTHPAVSLLQGWDDLPDGLLHSILPLLGSFRNLLAFAATCPSWRAAFYSYPSKYTTLFPPLLIQPNFHVPAPNIPSSNGHHKLRTCKVVDPVNPNTALRCQIDEETLHEMHFAGSSYGQLIFCSSQRCLLVDPFRGTEVSPPRLLASIECGELSVAEVSTPLLPVTGRNLIEENKQRMQRMLHPGPFNKNSHFCGVLTAPLASPSSHLLVNTRFSLFDWPVGSDSWHQLQLPNSRIIQILDFNGRFIAMDNSHRIYILQLAPQLGLQEITIERHLGYRWLVGCGDMLLAVSCFQIHRLDMSTKPAKWVEVKSLDGWALFQGGHVMSPAIPFMGPEQWGGRSKCLYYARYVPAWSIYSLGDDADLSLNYGRYWSRGMQPLWLYPSMFC